jgi:hypothetical protein
MARQAIVSAHMQMAPDAKKLAGTTLRLAKLDAGSKIYDSTIKPSAKLFNAGILGLQSS